MITYAQFKKTNIDLAPLGFEQNENFVPYYCTPKNANILASAGVDGIHYCTIRGFGELIFAVSPMNFGDCVHPIARSFEDLLRLLLSCVDMAALEQCYAWDEEQFKAFMIDCPATEKQQALLDTIRDEFGLEPIEDAFSYVKELQAEFDLTRIPYTEDYYDPDMNPHAEPQPIDWKVTYDGGFWASKGRSGKEIPIGKIFMWNGEKWYVPAVYACSKGLIVDICMEAEPEGIQAFIDKWDLLREEEHLYSRRDQRQMEREHPLNVDFRADVLLNGKKLQGDHGYGTVWIPPSCLADGVQTETEAKSFLEHYGLDMAKGWMLRRCSFQWATARKPDIKSLTLTLEREPAEIPGIRFHTPKPGESISFTHPISDTEHTLTVQEYEQKEMDPKHFHDQSMEYPCRYTAMAYTLTPDIPNQSFMLRDSDEGDKPRRRTTGSSFEPVSACSVGVIGIIGGADGPTAVFVSAGSAPKLHAACSALRFEPREDVLWEITFREKLTEDLTVELIGKAAK